jgi:hypothetical protein
MGQPVASAMARRASFFVDAELFLPVLRRQPALDEVSQRRDFLRRRLAQQGGQ